MTEVVVEGRCLFKVKYFNNSFWLRTDSNGDFMKVVGEMIWMLLSKTYESQIHCFTENWFKRGSWPLLLESRSLYSRQRIAVLPKALHEYIQNRPPSIFFMGGSPVAWLENNVVPCLLEMSRTKLTNETWKPSKAFTTSRLRAKFMWVRKWKSYALYSDQRAHKR